MGIFFDFQDIICYVGKKEACSMVERKESDVEKRKIRGELCCPKSRYYYLLSSHI